MILDAQKMRRIWIGLLYNNEVELLDIALRLYTPIASGIDILHASVTTSGRRKPLYPLPTPLPSIVRETVLTNFSLRRRFTTEDFTVETASRRFLGRLLRQRARGSDDCIVFPDLDELLHPAKLRAACERLTHEAIARFHLMWFHTSMWQLALPGAWKVNVMVLASTLRRNSDNLDALRASRRNIVDIAVPPARQCEDSIPVGWHCTWCFPTRDQFIQKMQSSAHVAYAQYAHRGGTLRKMMCKGHWLDQGVHGSLRQCHDIPNGSIRLLNDCAKYAMLPRRPPPDNVCAERVVPCRRQRLIDACRLMREHTDERNAVWQTFRRECSRP